MTATVYIPSQGKLACGRSNGSIVIVPATQSIMLQVLENKLLDANSELYCRGGGGLYQPPKVLYYKYWRINYSTITVSCIDFRGVF